MISADEQREVVSDASDSGKMMDSITSITAKQLCGMKLLSYRTCFRIYRGPITMRMGAIRDTGKKGTLNVDGPQQDDVGIAI